MSSVKGNKVIIEKTGGVEALEFKQVEFPAPSESQVRVHIKAIGLNFLDVYVRSGAFPASLPTGLGVEAAGEVESVGSNVTNVKVGDRVTFMGFGVSSYADYAVIPSDIVIPLPDDISFEQAAATTLKGLTAQYMVKQVKPLQKGDKALLWAAAGGVGNIVTQWLTSMGVDVIAITSNDDKLKLVKELGAWKTINHKTEDVVEKVKEYTNGEKVAIVYDSIGKATFETSLDCLKPHGLLVSNGNASGPVTGVNLHTLIQKGSLFVTGSSVFSYTSLPGNLKKMSADLFDAIKTGAIKININQRYSLKDIAKAHTELESGKTSGATVIIP